ncbi:MAG TPA: hypothetical protein VG899_07995 [Mycobacteriales bacterium]|nr:hypothetical protein [Mycobacteriales bacterium]
MNDSQLATMVRDSVADVHADTPLTQIIRRGHTIRARRRAPVAAAATVAVAGAGALAASTLTASGHPTQQATDSRSGANRSPRTPATHVRLAAWTVAKQADGDISITLRQLRDPGGLQATLRADGVPASVTFDQLNSSCRTYPASSEVLDEVFPSDHQLPTPPAGTPRMTRATPDAPPPSPTVTMPTEGSTVVVINPSALPQGAGVQLASSTSAGSVAILLPRLVATTSACTG